MKKDHSEKNVKPKKLFRVKIVSREKFDNYGTSFYVLANNYEDAENKAILQKIMDEECSKDPSNSVLTSDGSLKNQVDDDGYDYLAKEIELISLNVIQ